MNQQRRKRLKEAMSYIDKAKDIIQDILIEEEIAFDNLSEGLQQTMRGETMEENINLFDEATESLDEVIETLKEVE